MRPIRFSLEPIDQGATYSRPVVRHQRDERSKTRPPVFTDIQVPVAEARPWWEQMFASPVQRPDIVGVPVGIAHPGDTPAEACTRKFLMELMTRDPNNEARRFKAELKSQCRTRCKMADRAFDQIWAACIRETGAVAYKKSGPRGEMKSPRQRK